MKNIYFLQINRLSPEVKKTENVVTMQQNMAVCSKLKNDFGAKLATISHLQEQIGLRVQEFKEGIERYAENAKEDVQDVDKIDAALDQKLKVRLEQGKINSCVKIIINSTFSINLFLFFLLQ